MQDICGIASNSGKSLEDINALADCIYDTFFKSEVASNATEQCAESEARFQHLLDERTNQPAEIIAPSSDDVWIFGYGSLVWKADFPYIDRRRGFICGYQRRFYQHSIDHRGVPEKPGRVVTLMPTYNSNDHVYGVAYRIAAKQKSSVLDHLDYREKNGYERCTLKFEEFPEGVGSTFDVIMYIATNENDSYAGNVWEISRIAEQIFTSAGPSGSNREYLFNLAAAMRALFPGASDDHLSELEMEVLRLVKEEEPKMLERSLKREIAAILLKDDNQMPSDGNLDEQLTKEIQQLRNSCKKPGWREALLAKELKLT